MKKHIKYFIILISVVLCITATAFAGCFIFGDGGDGTDHSHNYTDVVTKPTCTEQGYTTHTCTCGDEYVDTYIQSAGHKLPSSAVRENEVAPTCSKEGGYDEVSYCTVCGEEISSKHKAIDKTAHTPKAAAYENEVDSTCSKFGGYDSVVRCNVCSEIISSTHISISKKPHTPKAAVRENEVASTCSKQGGYDEVVYCDVCGGKVSTEHKTFEMPDHDFEGGKCKVCGELHYNVDDLRFSFSDDGTYFIVTGYKGKPTYANIPVTYADIPVKEIANSAFDGCGSLKSVTIEGVTTIGNSAFWNCTGLESVTICDGVTSIGNYAFRNCSGLTSLKLGDDVKEIGEYAFDGCSSLTSLTVSVGVKFIRNYAFRECTALETVYWNATKCTFVSGDYPIFGNCTKITTIIVGDNVEEITRNTFKGCSSVTNVTIGNGVTTIEENAFLHCSGLKSITMGSSVNYIEYSAFYGCTALESVYYKGTAANWAKIYILSSNWHLEGAPRYYYSETEPALSGDGTAYDGNYWHYDNDGKVVVWVYAQED